MNATQTRYYYEMLNRNRMFIYKKDGRTVCLITFYIGDAIDERKFVRYNMWKVMEDNYGGKVCFIDHLLTDKHPDNPKLSYRIWAGFKRYIRKNFEQCKIIRWNRWKNDSVKTYEEALDERISVTIS